MNESDDMRLAGDGELMFHGPISLFNRLLLGIMS